MSLVNWITNNPDAVLGIVGFIGARLGWKRVEAATERQRAQLTAALRSEVFRVLADPSKHATVRAHLTGAIRAAGGRLGIPDRIVSTLAAVLVEEAEALFYERLIERQLNALGDAAAVVPALLKDVTP